MPSFNKVILIGRLTRDPELRYTSGGLAVTKFSIAVDRRFKNQQGERVTDFFDCTAWRQKAEFVANYVTKGRLVAVEGVIEFNEATGQDGQKRRYTNIVCDNVETLDSQRDGEGGGSGGGNYGANAGGANAGGAGGNASGNAGGNAGGANRGGGAQGGDDDGGGYFPDEDPAPRANAGGNAAGNAAGNAGGNAAGGNRPPASAGNGGNAGGARAAAPGGNAGAAKRAPEPAFPAEDDFDDSDPFADQ